jgi:protein TonB
MGYQALLFCPDEKIARTVTQVLNDLDFTVEPCTEPFAAVKKLMAQHFDAVVVDCDNEQNATLLFKSARNSATNQASLAVAVVEGQAGVAKAFRIGANLVLTKPINVEQAKGTLRVARGLLRKGGEAAKTVVAPSSAAPIAAMPAKPATLAPRPAAPKPPAPSPAAATRTPSVPAPILKPAMAPAMPSMAASAQVAEIDDQDSDTILETEIDETPAPAPVAETKPAAATSVPAAGTAKFPWQPSPKMAEPMASALRRAAEAVGQVETAEPPAAKPTAPAPAPAPEKRPMSGAMFQAQASAAAAAPAPAIEKPAPASIIPAVDQKPEPVQPPALVVDTTRAAAPPTFFPGAYDAEESEGGSKTKALIIVAAVVLLACSAGYLSWRNTNSSKSSAAPAGVTQPGPASAKPAASQPAHAAEPSSPAQPVATDITLGGVSAAPNAPTPHASKPSPKTPAASEDSAPEPEVTKRLIVKQDSSHITKPAASPDTEQVQAPSAIGMGATADTKALAGIGNTPVNVPKAAQTLKVSQGVMEGLVIKRVQPRYPPQALQMRIQGSVQLQATITKDGDIKNLKVVSGDAVLARAAQEAVKQWKYKPYFLNGEPVPIETQIQVNFRLPN